MGVKANLTRASHHPTPLPLMRERGGVRASLVYLTIFNAGPLRGGGVVEGGGSDASGEVPASS